MRKPNLEGWTKGLSRAVTCRRERMKRGYSETDLWNFDYYLARMLADALPKIPFHDADKEKVNFIVDQMDKYAKGPMYKLRSDKDYEEFTKCFKYLGEVFEGLWY